MPFKRARFNRCNRYPRRVQRCRRSQFCPRRREIGSSGGNALLNFSLKQRRGGPVSDPKMASRRALPWRTGQSLKICGPEVIASQSGIKNGLCTVGIIHQTDESPDIAGRECRSCKVFRPRTTNLWTAGREDVAGRKQVQTVVSSVIRETAGVPKWMSLPARLMNTN